MTNRLLTLSTLFAVAWVMAGCGSPSDPSPIQAPPLPQPWTFRDPATGIATADLQDFDGDILHFNVAGEFVWVATGARFPEYTGSGGTAYIYNKRFQIEVMFGTKDGQRRAFLTFLCEEADCERGYLADATLVDGELLFKRTNVPVPGR